MNRFGGKSITKGGKNTLIHSALQIRFTQLSAFIVIRAAVPAQAAEIVCHKGLAFAWEVSEVVLRRRRGVVDGPSWSRGKLPRSGLGGRI